MAGEDLLGHDAQVRSLADARRLAADLRAVREVLAVREGELFVIKGPCSNERCQLHHAHAGPCDEERAGDDPVTAGAS